MTKEYPTKYCEICKKPISVHINAKGHKESVSSYLKHRYCSNACKFKGNSIERTGLNDATYYSAAMNRMYCSASQYKSFMGFPLMHSCEARAIAELKSMWVPEVTKPMLIGSILDSLWEGATAEQLVEKFPNCVSTRGETKGQLKAEYQQAFQLYQRSLQDEMFCKMMSGEKQVIMTGTIADLPYKIKMDSFVDGVCITDLKTTQDASQDFRYFIPDSGERLPFYSAWGYDIQLAIYREIVRQNTGKTLRCYIAAIDKKPHPLPVVIELEPQLLDKKLEEVKRNSNKIIRLKNGEIPDDQLERCEECDYCRDTHKCVIQSNSEFETHEIQGA